MFTENDRVHIQIADTSRFARGAAECLDGKTGTVTEVMEHSVNGKWNGIERGPAVLVEFDEPARPWWTNQTPCAAFWFRPEDLTKIGRRVLPASVGMPGTLEKAQG